MSYSDILCNLSDLNAPPCAIKLIQSYLSGRSMCVRYKGTESTFEKCPGGGPQGGLLTGVLFILQVNKAGSPCPSPRQEHALVPTEYPIQSSQVPARRQEDCPRPINYQIQTSENPSLGQEETQLPIQYQILPNEIPSTRQNNEIIPLCHQSKNLHKKSFIDDLTLLEKISLSNLEAKLRIIGPLNYHDRFNLTMPPQKSILQHQLDDLKLFTSNHSMKLNSKKTKCLPFIRSKTKDFTPQLSLKKGSNLEVIYQLKLVGIVITSSLSWQAHIEYTIS